MCFIAFYIILETAYACVSYFAIHVLINIQICIRCLNNYCVWKTFWCSICLLFIPHIDLLFCCKYLCNNLYKTKVQFLSISAKMFESCLNQPIIHTLHLKEVCVTNAKTSCYSFVFCFQGGNNAINKCHILICLKWWIMAHSNRKVYHQSIVS